LETELKKEYETLSSLTERYNEYIEIFKLYDCQLKDDTTNHLLNIKSPQLSSTGISKTDRLEIFFFIFNKTCSLFILVVQFVNKLIDQIN
jgi:hypothetical protein